jgi:hypothetical protein
MLFLSLHHYNTLKSCKQCIYGILFHLIPPFLSIILWMYCSLGLIKEDVMEIKDGVMPTCVSVHGERVSKHLAPEGSQGHDLFEVGPLVLDVHVFHLSETSPPSTTCQELAQQEDHGKIQVKSSSGRP